MSGFFLSFSSPTLNTRCPLASNTSMPKAQNHSMPEHVITGWGVSVGL